MSHNHQMPASQGEHRPTFLNSRAVPGCAPEADEACSPHTHTLSDHGHERRCLLCHGHERCLERQALSVDINTRLLSAQRFCCIVQLCRDSHQYSFLQIEKTGRERLCILVITTIHFTTKQGAQAASHARLREWPREFTDELSFKKRMRKMDNW